MQVAIFTRLIYVSNCAKKVANLYLKVTQYMVCFSALLLITSTQHFYRNKPIKTSGLKICTVHLFTP